MDPGLRRECGRFDAFWDNASADAVALDGGAVELDAEAGALGELDRAVAFEAQWVLQQLLADRIGVLVPFKHQRVGDRSGEMQRSDEVDRAGEGVVRLATGGRRP